MRKINGFRINQSILAELDLSKGGKLTSKDGTDYTLAVTNNGVLYAYAGSVDPDEEPSVAPLNPPVASETVTKLADLETYKLYINSFYCGGVDTDTVTVDEHTLNFCSHNFVELANCTGKDINLSGMSLQYAVTGTDWKVLPLKGIIKDGSTFLIRGAECAVPDLAKIKVDNYDMEWRIDETGTYSPAGTPIKFSSEKAKFFFCFSTDRCPVVNPFYVEGGSTIKVSKTYIDLVGAGTGIDGYEKSAYKTLSSDNLYKKYYALDPVKQATKDLSSRDNSTLTNYVDLKKDDGDLYPSIEKFTPRASFENKNIFSDKTDFEVDKPTMITCSFGIQATDGGTDATRATRCFNWLSRGIHDEYIWVRTKGANTWGTAHESFKKETGVRRFYNRISKEVPNGRVITAHKYILKGLTAGTYEYVAGHKLADGTPDFERCTPVHEFIVRTSTEVNSGFTFVQTSDQQGFTWDEYQVWAAASSTIMKEDAESKIQFMVNTGDIAQNGNRMNEWLDYFNGKSDKMNNLEEMAAVGNNDLSPAVIYMLGDGEDKCKVSMENYLFFFACEIDEENPPVFKINSVEYFMPSLYSFNYGNVHFLCMNTEIKREAEESKPVYDKNIYQSVYNFPSYGNFYPLIKGWCERDFQKNNYTSKTWNIVYCHEMPFTLLTTDVIKDPVGSTTKGFRTPNKGCHASDNVPTPTVNTEYNYWFSEFCQTHKVRLVLGGHKHTQATSWPLLENVTYNEGQRAVDSWHPKIVLSRAHLESELAKFALTEGDNPTGLTEVTVDGVARKYPNTWVSGGTIVPTATGFTYFCDFAIDDELDGDENGVVYAMSQATGYKHTSNRELPSDRIPWLRYYYPIALDATEPDGEQKFPFYTLWNITSNKIEGKVRKVKGIFDLNGKFDINKDGVWTKQGLSALDDHTAPLASVNGLSSSTPESSTDIIEIKQ